MVEGKGKENQEWLLALTSMAQFVVSYKAKGHQFGSQPGPSPWVGACAESNQSMFLSLFFLPPFPSL